tara:strand:+ start:280 stop:582 length:303 start_codon:yes stop_codon:yes gene_type:complete
MTNEQATKGNETMNKRKPTKATIIKQVNAVLKTEADSKIVKFEWLSTGWCKPRGEVDFFRPNITFKIARITIGAKDSQGHMHHYATRHLNVESNGSWDIR